MPAVNLIVLVFILMNFFAFSLKQNPFKYMNLIAAVIAVAFQCGMVFQQIMHFA